MTVAFDKFLSLFALSTREVAIVIADESGTITAWSRAAEHLFGYDSDEAVGQPLSILFPPEDRAIAIPEHERAIALHDTEAEDDRWMQRKDGGRFWATGVLVPVRDHNGGLQGFAKVLRDRTDLKSQIVLLEKQLEEEKEENNKKSRFISTLAHELRNPLHSMRNAAHVLSLPAASESERSFAVVTVERQLDFIARMIEDLIDIARLGRGKLKLEKKVVSLNAIVNEALETCAPNRAQLERDIRVISTEVPIMTEADPTRIKQVFVNLIHNAIKYTAPSGRIWIKLDLEGNDAIVRVEDNGIGISPEELPVIFDLFTQAVGAKLSNERGLGLGLAVVKELVALHDGSVAVRSDGVGKGSQFSVRLPLTGECAMRPNRPERG